MENVHVKMFKFEMNGRTYVTNEDVARSLFSRHYRDDICDPVTANKFVMYLASGQIRPALDTEQAAAPGA